ncbi:MAG TPA: heme ABC exporter ATP-binding protein CcmA, partial [Legionellaceae bacterium]|nr:heme ABC exporter ATP-binding protein CcmA [Legionellaceae bacterium]
MHVSVQQLYFDYPSPTLSLCQTSLLHKISFDLPKNGILHISGANGSGKTTLLKILAGFFRPVAGYIFFDQKDIWSALPEYQQHICYLGHKNGISMDLTAWEHCHFDLQIPKYSPQIPLALQQLSLWHVKDLPCQLLSAGQKRRVALLRLLFSSASLWLLDEPIVGLDDAGITVLMSLLQNHITSGGQVIYTSHQALPWGNIAYQEYC